MSRPLAALNISAAPGSARVLGVSDQISKCQNSFIKSHHVTCPPLIISPPAAPHIPQGRPQIPANFAFGTSLAASFRFGAFLSGFARSQISKVWNSGLLMPGPGSLPKPGGVLTPPYPPGGLAHSAGPTQKYQECPVVPPKCRPFFEFCRFFYTSKIIKKSRSSKYCQKPQKSDP